MLRTGAPWRDLPCKFGPWQGTYERLSRWTSVGLWVQLRRAMRGSKQKIGHFASLDSTSVRVHQHGATTRRGRDVHGVGISPGGRTTKVHLLKKTLSADRKEESPQKSMLWSILEEIFED